MDRQSNIAHMENQKVRKCKKQLMKQFRLCSQGSLASQMASQMPLWKRLTSRREKADLIAAETPASETPLGGSIHSHWCKAHLSCYRSNVDDQAGLQDSTSPT